MPHSNHHLRNAGLKVTLPRVKILQILQECDDQSRHLSAEDVYQLLRDAERTWVWRPCTAY
jgi:Fur family ferric uptake transcriptional regulator